MTEKRYNARRNEDNDDFQDRFKAKLEDVVGIVHTDEPTDSVELKKEYYNSKSKNKRYEEMYSKYCGLVVADMSTNPRICSARRISDMEIVDELNELNDENEQLKQRIKELESFIRQLANDCGGIELMNGYNYKIKKVMIDALEGLSEIQTKRGEE